MKLLIAIPTLDMIPVEFMESFAKLISHLSDEGIEYKVKLESNTLIYYAREHLARYAIINKFTHVLWLDSDMVFTPEIVEDLQFSGQKFVTGIAHSRKPPYSSCIFTEIFPGVQKWQGNTYPSNTFQIAACGMACCLMSIEVLEKVHERYGMMFQPTDTYGEDVAFCWRATECGFTIWAEPGVRVGHIGKTIIYPEDWRETP